ncbi:unnamed protein product [Effrenium voratum]|uniref:PH domain-containing protein n=1 Tax=Effrenium voratum TaxID=2562239 RepID=A0AA36JSL8_9DINO|nr:unnamed protein product [Effrenium voratum]
MATYAKDSGSTTASMSLTPSCRSELAVAKKPRQPSHRVPATEMRLATSVAACIAFPRSTPRRMQRGEELRARDEFMQVRIEGFVQKRVLGMWWTPFWAVLDQSALRFYKNEQASISRPEEPEELVALPLRAELSMDNLTWVVCRDARTRRKVMYIRSGSEPACWEDVATARLWHWALNETHRSAESARSSQ